MGGIILPIVKPIIDSQVRMYELNEERFNGKSVIDDDLKPVVEQGNQDANYTIAEVGRGKRSIITDFVGDGKNLMTSAGFLKEFAFNLAAPVIKSLSRDGNSHAIEGLTNRLIPQTGLGAHLRGAQVRDYVDNGNVQSALD